MLHFHSFFKPIQLFPDCAISFFLMEEAKASACSPIIVVCYGKSSATERCRAVAPSSPRAPSSLVHCLRTSLAHLSVDA